MAETIGSLVDKITIVELKRFHVAERADRPGMKHADRLPFIERHSKLCDQIEALSVELSALMVNPPQPFRQFKMYNDPQYQSTP